MNQAALRAPQEFSKSVLALAPFTGDGPETGPSIDRTGYLSCIVDLAFAVSGAPTGGTVTGQLQDSADGTTFANFGAPVVTPVSGANAAGGVASLPVDLSGARQFVRFVETGAPTGGASPVVSGAAVLRLFGPDRLPAI